MSSDTSRKARSPPTKFFRNYRMMKNFTVYENLIRNVSVVNSTNSSSFMTGLLWDGRNSTSYNGSQGLYVITEVNQVQNGRCGLCDFEMKIPSNLRKYRKTDLNTVTIYVEIK